MKKLDCPICGCFMDPSDAPWPGHPDLASSYLCSICGSAFQPSHKVSNVRSIIGLLNLQPKLTKLRKVKAGMKFCFDNAVYIVVEENKLVVDDWWCRLIVGDTGLWSFCEATIIKHQIPKKKGKQ